MLRHNLILAIVLLAALASAAPAAGSDAPIEPPAVTISQRHRRFLSDLARWTMRDAVSHRDLYEPAYVPAALRSLEVEVVVRVREGGFLRDSGVGGPAPVAMATRDASLAAIQWLATRQGEVRPRVDALNRLLVEIEVVGQATPVPFEGDWTVPGALDPFIEPGVHGFVLGASGDGHRVCPTELFTRDVILTDAVQSITQRLRSARTKLAGLQIHRFRTAHWYQAQPDDRIVSLVRGLTPVEPGAVNARDLDTAIDRLAKYMVYRQLPSGLFTYRFDPANNAYSEENNLVRQVGACVAVAAHARWSGYPSSREAADRAIQYHLQGLTPVPGDDGAAYLATADGRNKLGVTALLALAMAEYPYPDRYAATREKLVKGMLWLQHPSGMFITAFPPARQIKGQEYFPGEALLAMAAHYHHNPNAETLDAFDRAIQFYRIYFRQYPSPAFVPWQVQAYGLIVAKTKRQDYRDYVFEMTDWLADKQITQSNCDYPDMFGGIASYRPGRAGVSTASYLEGFATALAMAQEAGDTKRAKRYERVVRAAARFVLQLQVRPDEAYFLPSPQDAVWGIRTSPSLNLLRIDHCQHALIALMKTRQVLFPEG